MRVLHLPTSVGGNAWGLAQAEKLVGLDSKVLIDSNNWLNYPYDYCMDFDKRTPFGIAWTMAKTFLHVKNAYDVFHFNFGRTLLDIRRYGINYLDLPFYKGKKIMTFNGCDARQKFPTMNRVAFSACHDKACYGGMCNDGSFDVLRKKRIQKASQYIDHMFALNPDLMYFLPEDKTTFLPYSIANWETIPYHTYEVTNKIKIVHAPTDRAAKGSSYILKALENLQRKYSNLDINIIEKMPYQEALKHYQEAHIVIDQVMIGWYGGFGVEVMKMGKPLAVFLREEDLKFIPNAMAKELQEAIINVNPFTIEEVLSYYIENSALLYVKSQAALAYVHRWHNPLYIAGLVKHVYEA